jgi:prefoldin alpha subunit
MTDLSYANMTLESIQKEKENAELLVPIGGSSYLKVKLVNTEKIVVGMGAGVSIEKTLPEAKAIVTERLDEIEKARAAGQQQFSQIAERINQGRTRMEDLLAELKQGQQ